MRFLKKRAKGSWKAAPAVNRATYEYPVNPFGRNEWSTPAGVIIDGACYTLQGEPPKATGGNWWTGHVAQ